MNLYDHPSIRLDLPDEILFDRKETGAETEAEDMVLVYCDGQEIKWSQHQEHVSVAPDVEAFNQKHYGGKLTRRQLGLLHHELKRISCKTRGQKA